MVAHVYRRFKNIKEVDENGDKMWHYWLTWKLQKKKKKSTIFILPKSVLPSHAQRHSSSKLIHTAVNVDLIRQPRYINMQIRDVYRNSLPIGNTSCHRQQNHSEDLALVNWQIPPGYCCPINHGPFGRAAFLNRRSLPFSSGKELSLRRWNKLLWNLIQVSDIGSYWSYLDIKILYLSIIWKKLYRLQIKQKHQANVLSVLTKELLGKMRLRYGWQALCRM